MEMSIYMETIQMSVYTRIHTILNKHKMEYYPAMKKDEL